MGHLKKKALVEHKKGERGWEENKKRKVGKGERERDERDRASSSGKGCML